MVETMQSELEAMKALLLHNLDPIGVSSCAGAEDEYDHYALQICKMLGDGADAATIADYLNWVATSLMSLQGNIDRDRKIASKAIAIHSAMPTRDE